jgi:hypothetical protein
MKGQLRQHQQSSLSYPSELLSYLVLSGGLLTVAVSAYMVISTYSSLPHWDEWELVDRVATGKPLSLTWICAQHNEHRIPFTKLLFLADLKLFHGTQVLLLATIFLISIAHVVLLSWSLQRLGGLRGAAWRTGTGLIAFCILSPIQQENLVWGFQVSFVLPTTMATLATLSLLLYHSRSTQGNRRSAVTFLLLSIAAASMATFSLANGMLLWPLLVLAATILKMNRRTIASLIVVAVTEIGLYLFRFHLPSEPKQRLSIHYLRDVLEYVTLYFGSTWTHHAAGYAPIIIGFVGLCIAVTIALRELLLRPHRLFLCQISLLILFCVATALLTAIGRLSMGTEQATASRYQVFAVLFWCALSLSVLFWITSQRGSHGPLVYFSGFVLVLMLALATQVRNPLRDAGWHHIRLESISLALLAGVPDLDQLALAFPNPNLVIRDAEYLKRNHFSIFAGKRNFQLGQPLESAYHVHPAGECSGYVASSNVFSTTNSQGMRATGYAWNRTLGAPINEIVFASNDGRIRGFGSTVTISLRSVKPGPIADATRFGWLGYAGEIPRPGRIEVYGVIEKASSAICPFASISF